MCIWPVKPEDRHCEFCSFVGGCESRPIVTVKQEAVVEPEEVIPEVPDAEKHEIWWTYVYLMNGIVGEDIRSRKRTNRVVWARNFVAYQLHLDGYSSQKIGYVINRDHATVFHALDSVKHVLVFHQAYPREMEIWNKFQKMIHLQKSKTNEKDSEMVVVHL